MAQLNVPNAPKLDQAGIAKLTSNLKRALSRFDFDTGWVATASPVKHRLGIVPRRVLVQVSADKRGATFTEIEPDSVTGSQIAFTTALAYARVAANK